jgi:hypothetical protein
MLAVEEADNLMEVYLHVVDHQVVEEVMLLVLEVESMDLAEEAVAIVEMVVMV